MYLKSDRTKGVRFKDLTGQRFGKLTVIEFVGRGRNRHSKWKCKCDCGGESISFSTNLLRGIAGSCGCVKDNVLGNHTRKHGLTNTRIFKIWAGIRKRCTNPKSIAYKDYGGRGIKICERWSDFENFYADMIDGYTDTLTLDRIDPNGDYCKENCRWATPKEQSRNKRNSSFRVINGERKTIGEWSEVSGIASATIHNRIKAGWPDERLLERPNRKKTTIDQISKYLVF